MLLTVTACGRPEETFATAPDDGVAVATAAATSSCGWDPGFGLKNCRQSNWWLEFSVNDPSVATLAVEISGTPTRLVDLPNRIDFAGGVAKFTGGVDPQVRSGTLIRLRAIQSTGAGGSTATSAWFGYRKTAPTLYCQPCTPLCSEGGCGSDGCGGSCGSCDAGTTCLGSQCVCTPTCAANTCGDDGCGGTCGTCALGATCANGQCVTCTPFCAANSCGGDGCGGTCGPCAQGTSCVAGQCLAGCVAPWNPSWTQVPSSGEWWAEFQVAGGGVLPRTVAVQRLGGDTWPLSYSWGQWAGGVDNLIRGTWIVLHATNALGASAQTVPFRYLVDTSPLTDQCQGTPSTNTTCQPLSRGKVTFSFDDSGSSQPSIALPLLQRYGVKGTFFVVPQWHSWVSVAQTMLADGHEFAGHGMTHQTLTGLTAQQLDDELRLAKSWIQANIGGTVDSFATPSAAFNDAVVRAVKGYYGSHRGGEEDLNFVGTDVYRLQSHFMYNTSTIAGVCARIQEAATQKGWLFLTFHDFTNDAVGTQGFTMPAAVFEGILACATTTPGIDVVTARQATAAIRCGSP